MGINIMNFLVQKIGELLKATRTAHPYLREISKFHQRVKIQLESKIGPFSVKQAGKLQSIIDAYPEKVDQDKAYYLDNILLMAVLGFKCFIETQQTESLIMLKYMLRLSTEVPDHRTTIALFR